MYDKVWWSIDTFRFHNSRIALPPHKSATQRTISNDLLPGTYKTLKQGPLYYVWQCTLKVIGLFLLNNYLNAITSAYPTWVNSTTIFLI
jgi:hypothetical protein